TGAQARAREPLGRLPAFRQAERAALGPCPVGARAQVFDQLAGVDRDGAREPAAPVRRAGLLAVVAVLIHERVADGRSLRLPRHLAAQHDALPRRRGQVTARADRLAEAALDAGVRVRDVL